MVFSHRLEGAFFPSEGENLVGTLRGDDCFTFTMEVPSPPLFFFFFFPPPGDDRDLCRGTFTSRAFAGVLFLPPTIYVQARPPLFPFFFPLRAVVSRRFDRLVPFFPSP